MSGAQLMFSLFTGAAVTAQLDLGFRLGLFDILAVEPSTTSELSTKSGFQERYLKEWLSALTAAKVISYDPTTKRFSIPKENARVLTGPASIGIKAMCKNVLSMASNNEDLSEAFQNGGGLDYSHFQDLDWNMNSRDIDKCLVSQWLPKAGSIYDRLKAGESLRVLDIGVGKGLSTMLMAEAFPNSEFIGFDLSSAGINEAKSIAKQRGLSNVSFHVVDLVKEELSEDAHHIFDLVVAIDCIHDLSKPSKVLKDVYNMLKYGGVFFMQELNASSHLEKNLKNPMAALLYSISTMHCLTVSLSSPGGEGFGTLFGRENFLSVLKKAGFSNVQVETAPPMGLQLNFICKKETPSAKL